MASDEAEPHVNRLRGGLMFWSILIPILSVGGLALIFGVILGISARVFAVKTDPKVEQILDSLPGANCGGCGFPGCAVFAERVVTGEAGYNGCPAAGVDTTAQIAGYLGVDMVAANRKSAYVRCNGTDDNIERNYTYDGPKSCLAASQLAGSGNKSCVYSCIGLESCKNVCPFGAIKIVDSVAVISKTKCTACGKCVAVCPKDIIEIAPDKSRVRVMCNSKDKGKFVRKYCRAGCLGCSICQKSCQEGAIKVIDNLAQIDFDKCTLCMVCVDKCPAKVIKIMP